jgi:signal transduction histidine kinase
VNVIGAVILLVIGVLLARTISFRISRSIRALTGPAVSLGLSDAITIPPVEIQEVHELGQSLVTAGHLIEQRKAERDEAEAKLAIATAERDDLRRGIMRAQEQERLRLARDLHDQTGQSLTAAILELKDFEHQVEESDRDRVRLLRKQMEAMAQTLHRVAWQLRPASIDELGLASALENYLTEWSAQHAIESDFHCADAALDKRPDEMRTTIYRVVQEALTNIAKHATKATFVSIVIGDVDGTLRLTIEDNGCGFDPAASYSRLGLAGMRERLLLVGGDLEIESSPGAGTTIFARIPLVREWTAA